MSARERASIGAVADADGVHLRVWAPGHERVDVVVYGPAAEAVHPLDAEPGGYFAGRVAGIGPGARYKFRLDGGDTLPDPASRSQPDGVHAPSEVVDPGAFRWTDAGWSGVPLEELVIYEIHVGTATPEGTFDALIGRLDDLAELGISAIELMPVADFPGERNWGYDGVDLYAPANAYGGPEAMRRLVDAAHGRGLAVILDVVYNHLGPEGNYLPAFTSGRIFTERHHTPWGQGIRFEDPAVREFVIGSALQWAHEFHVDGLRLDATHAILDDSPTHILRELAERVRASLPPERHFALIAEDERNERRLITPPAEGGLGLDAVWADDLHHQLRRLLAGDHEGYYADFSGTTKDLAKTLRDGWFYQGQRSANRAEARGTPAAGIPPARFVHCIQNHDQVGNRALGERLNHQIALPAYRAACALLLLSPYTPLLWMGQEWAASSPFLYFTDHPEELGRLVTEGRRAEFQGFSAFADLESRDRIPDPQDPATFGRSKLDWEEREREPHAGVLRLHRELLALRRSEPALRHRGRDAFAAVALGPGAVALRRMAPGGEAILLVACFAGSLRVDLGEREETQAPEGRNWNLLLATEEGRFGGDEEGEVAALDPAGALEIARTGAVVLRV